MGFSLTKRFLSAVGKALFAGGALTASLYGMMTGESSAADQISSDREFINCRSLDAPLSVSDIEVRQTEMDRFQQFIDRSDDVGVKKNLEFSRKQLQIYNILDRFRLSLMDYQDWGRLLEKLGRNGSIIDEVCVGSYEDMDIPVLLKQRKEGRASLVINDAISKETSLGDGVTEVNPYGISIDDISEHLELDLVNRAVAFAALMGTAPMDRSLEVNDLALILTLWKAQAAAEQILQAIDAYQATGDPDSLKAARNDYDFLEKVIDDIAANAETMNKLGETVGAEDRTLLRQMVAVSMLNNPDVRKQVYLSLLAEIEEMADQNKNPEDYFNHEMTGAERKIRIENLDRSFTDLPLEQIYARWDGGVNDPAHDAIISIQNLRKKTADIGRAPAVSSKPAL